MGSATTCQWRANYFGTFTVTSVSFTGAELLYVPTLTTSLLTFGVFGPDGRTPVRMVIDHRVMDGMAFAAILARLEAILNGPILQELRRMPASTSPAIPSRAAKPRSAYFVFRNTSSVLNSPTRFTGARFSHFCTSGSALFQAIEPM